MSGEAVDTSMQACEPMPPLGRRCVAHHALPLYPDGRCTVGRGAASAVPTTPCQHEPRHHEHFRLVGCVSLVWCEACGAIRDERDGVKSMWHVPPRRALTHAPAPAPVRMLLPCPNCGARHVDEGSFATKSHHTHACQTCGHVWRPALVPTVGVRFLPGYRDESVPEPPPAPSRPFAIELAALVSAQTASLMAQLFPEFDAVGRRSERSKRPIHCFVCEAVIVSGNADLCDGCSSTHRYDRATKTYVVTDPMTIREAMLVRRPRYSGEDSRSFWDRVNALEGPVHSHVYELGIILQELEGRVLRALADGEVASVTKRGAGPT